MPLARHVADRDGDPPVGERDVIEEIASHALRRFVEIEELVTFDAGPLVGKKPELHLRGEIEVALVIALLEGGGVQLRVFERQGRLCGDAGQHFQVVFGKRHRMVERIDLNRPQRLSRLGHQRRAHHRADSQVGSRCRRERTACRRRRRPKESPAPLFIASRRIVMLSRAESAWFSRRIRSDCTCSDRR